MKDVYYAVAHRSQTEIDSFKTRYTRFDNSVIPDIFQQSLNLTVVEWQPSKSWGSSHLIYFVNTKEQGQLVFRANAGFSATPEHVMLTEKLITQKVAKLGIPTNHVLYVDISRTKYPFDYQIQKVLEGKDPEIHFAGGQKDYDQISFELGVNVAKYHTLSFDNFGRFDPTSAQAGTLKGEKTSNYEYITTCLESDLEYLIKAKVITFSKSKTIIKLFDDRKSIINIDRGVLIHHDLADHNITFENNHLKGIFDWEAAVISDPVLDLASCPTWKTLYSREEKLLEGYESISKLPENFSEKRNIYLLRTMLWKMVYAIRMNILNPDRINKFKTALQPFQLL